MVPPAESCCALDLESAAALLASELTQGNVDNRDESSGRVYASSESSDPEESLLDDPKLQYGLIGLPAVGRWVTELDKRGDTLAHTLANDVVVSTKHAKIAVLIIASSHHGRDSDEALCEIAKDDREMADWSDKLAVHKDWYTFPRLHAAANGSRQFNVQVDLSEVMRCAGAPSSIFARGRRQPKVPIMTAPHLLIHGLWTMAVAHKERAERATARNDEVAAQHDEVMAHELFALVLLSQLCKTHGGVPRLYGTDEAWLACIRHPEHRGGYSAAKLFVEEELQPGSAIVQHLYQTFSGHVSEHVLEEALTWITQRFKHEIEVLPAGHIPSPHRSRSQSRSPHHAGRASAHSLGHASSRYFPQDRRLASSSRF